MLCKHLPLALPEGLKHTEVGAGSDLNPLLDLSTAPFGFLADSVQPARVVEAAVEERVIQTTHVKREDLTQQGADRGVELFHKSIASKFLQLAVVLIAMAEHAIVGVSPGSQLDDGGANVLQRGPEIR